MRPRILEVHGWMPYREAAVIEFPDDIFLLSGETGSGKSAMIEALTFALYGETSRLGSTGTANLISSGADEAVLRLDFDADGQRYRITRTLRRTKEGGLNQRALLEIWDGTEWEALENKIRNVQGILADVVGLSYDAFTRAAVLPQGKFAEMLTGAPDKRRAVLTEILDLDRYGKVGQLARARALALGQELGVLELAIARAGAPVEEVAEVQRSLEACDLQETILTAWLAIADEASVKIQEKREALERWRIDWLPGTLLAAETYARRQSTIEDEMARLTDELTAKRAVVTAQLGEEETLQTRVAEIRGQVAQHPDRRADLQAAHTVENFIRRLQELATLVPQAEREAERLVSAAEVEQANQRLVQRQHAAIAVQEAIRDGDPCPVCGEVYFAARAPLIDLGHLGELEQAQRDSTSAVREGADAIAHGRVLESESQQLTSDYGPRVLTIADEIRAIEVAIGERTDLELRASDADAALLSHEQARRRAEEAVRTIDEAIRALSDGTGVPPSGAAMLAAAAGVELKIDVDPTDPDAVRRLGAHFRTIRETIELRITELQLAVRTALVVEVGQDLEIETSSRRLNLQALPPERARLLERLHTLQLREQERERDVAAAAELRTEAEIYQQLERALQADEFLDFLQRETLNGIVRRAGMELRGLSDGRYDLALTGPAEISVADEWAGGEMRPVATLSGGETFLASLAIGLAVAEAAQAGSARRLDVLIIDEGFGTLDPQALEHVGRALAHLRSGHRTVGLISHVDALREHVGIVYEVEKTVAGSTITTV